MGEGVGELTTRYSAALRRFLSDSAEDDLLRAHDLGREFLDQGLGVLELASIHHDSVAPLLADGASESRLARLLRASEFFSEAISPFEMSLLGFREMSVRLKQLNQDLERRVMTRTTELAKANEALRAEAGERERVLADLKRANDTLDAVVQSSPLAIVGTDAQGRVVVWNKGAERIFGQAAKAVLGQPYPASLDRGGLNLGAALRRVSGGAQLHDEDASRALPDKPPVQIRYSGAPFAGAAGSPGALLVLEDVTDSRTARRALEQVQKMDAIGQLTGGMAHDFNNLLTVVIGNLELLLEGASVTPASRELATRSLKAAQRGADLTRKLLAFARRQSLEATSIDINELVVGIADLLRRTLGEQIETQTVLVPDLWLAMADAAQVESAVTNLAINARDAMPEGGRLTIETANKRLDERYCAANPEVSPGDYVMLAVSDTGIGIPPEILSRVFEPFFTTKAPGKGTGLGLSMIYGFAKQSKGHAKIYSEVGHGTTVRLYLPRSINRSAQGAADTSAAVAPRAPTRVLLVEDNDDVRSVALAQLKSFGCQVVEATSGPDAVRIMQADQPFDLLFTDLVMPGGMTGVEVARQAQRLRPGIKIIFTSGFSEAAVEGAADTRELGLIISKPYTKLDLIRSLQRALARPL